MITKSLLLSVSALVVLSSTAMAQSVPAKSSEPLARPFVLSTQGGARRAFPSVFGASSAFVAPKGAVYGALTYTNPRGGVAGRGGDADLSFGVGLGNPISGIGVNLGVDVTGTMPLGDAGAFSLTFARALNVSENSATFASLGVGSLGGWGTTRGIQPKYTGTITHLTNLGQAGNEFPLMITGGYASKNTFSRTAIGTLSDGAFLGAGIGVARNLSLSASATQTQLNLGATMTIPGLNGVAISAGYYDVTNSVSRRQASITVSYSKLGLFGK